MNKGSKTWVFPDGDIPQSGDKEPFGHESLVILITLLNLQKEMVRYM